MDDETKNREIFMVDDEFFNLIINKYIYKIKKNKEKLYFLIIK